MYVHLNKKHVKNYNGLYIYTIFKNHLIFHHRLRITISNFVTTLN